MLKLTRGALSCDSGLIVLEGGVTAEDGRGPATAGTERPTIDDPIIEVYYRGFMSE